jgi:DNA-binding FrmR family transcriptional regulator
VEQAQVQADVVNRLKRVQGQVAGIVAMIESGRSCQDVVTQLAAASKALDRAAFKVVASGLRDCLVAQERGESAELSQEQLEKLFLTLA